jgi:UDP-glucose 4-epimerase
VRTKDIVTDHTLSAALGRGVKKVVVLRPNKAAYSINAIGMSKALKEKVTIARSAVAAREGVVCCVTRYGNVMASRASVIPLFLAQLREGRPLTLPEPDMTRSMMSIDDAVDLVLYVFDRAPPGDLFVQ